jgi:hypothetical protein
VAWLQVLSSERFRFDALAEAIGILSVHFNIGTGSVKRRGKVKQVKRVRRCWQGNQAESMLH